MGLCSEVADDGENLRDHPVLATRYVARKARVSAAETRAGCVEPLSAAARPNPCLGHCITRGIGLRRQAKIFRLRGAVLFAGRTRTEAAGESADPHRELFGDRDLHRTHRTATFLRHAKGNFIRLQAAWDKGDVADIREFTTPEVFSELKMQITERGAQADYTDVVTIEAELLGIENDGRDYLASVKFYGTIKPSPTALAEPFQEVWNLSKPVSGNAGWLLAGIQQLA